MSPLQDVFGWVLTLLVLSLPGLLAAVLWTPLLLSCRVRTLVVALPPRGSLLPTYVGIALTASVPYVLGLAVIVTVLPSEGAAWSNAIFTLVLAVGVVYTLFVPTAAVVGLPRLDVAWDPSDSPVASWLLLAVGGFWYAFTFAVPLFALAVLFAWPGGY
ncbi:MAG: hypothetical protein ACQET5_06785 [Halobacteriota archaeon]|uniref:hypothetical protein n=1 Tax=Natronomonas sp. TaxID=2184060 RepID=UPI0039758085